MSKEQSCFLETGGACTESTELAGMAQPRRDELAIPACPTWVNLRALCTHYSPSGNRFPRPTLAPLWVRNTPCGTQSWR